MTQGYASQCDYCHVFVFSQKDGSSWVLPEGWLVICLAPGSGNDPSPETKLDLCSTECAEGVIKRADLMADVNKRRKAKG